MRAHTATHLLHAQLAAIFPQTKQAGSLVDEDYLRFDFYADTALTEEQIDRIEQNINTQITQALPVDIQEISYDAAIQAGAKAFFEDKYGDTVRVVSIGSQKQEASSQKLISIELCGWTHVSNTSHIGAFAIISQESVAAWTKRITAVTGPKVAKQLRIKNQELKTIASTLWVQEKQIIDKIWSMIQEIKHLTWEWENFLASLIYLSLQQEYIVVKNFWTALNLTKSWYLHNCSVKEVWEIIKKNANLNDKNIIILSDDWNFMIISAFDKEAKLFAQSHWLKWWGSDAFFQGKDLKVLEIVQ